MELRHLAVFVAVAEETSFTRAGDRLHVVQSAVSAAIRSLEAELGASLFDRTTHRVSLTDAGRALLPEARATLTAADAARDAVQEASGGLRGTVTLGVMQAEALAPFSVAALLAAFRASHPDVELQARQADAGAMATRVADGALDFAFVALPAPRAPGLVLTELASYPLHLAVHPGHELAGRRSVALSATAQETFADGPTGFGTRAAVDRAFTAAGLTRRVAVQVNEASTLIDFVRHGVAAAFLSEPLVGDRDGISLVPIRPRPPLFTTYIAEPSARRLGAAAQALLSLAKESVTPART